MAGEGSAEDVVSPPVVSACGSRLRALEGGDVMVKPPGFSIPGTKTSSHWPGRNCEGVCG